MAGTQPKSMCRLRSRPENSPDLPEKEDIPAIPVKADWLLVSYKDIALGWCKNLGSRLNNYYPKEWRIRMDLNTDKHTES